MIEISFNKNTMNLRKKAEGDVKRKENNYLCAFTVTFSVLCAL